MRRDPVLAFFTLAFLLSWLVAVSLALQRAGVLQTRLPYSLHYLMAFGPMLAALIVVGATEGRLGLGRFLARGFRLSVGWGWLAFALLAPLAFFGVGVVAAAMSGRAVPGIRELGQINFLPNLGGGNYMSFGVMLPGFALGVAAGSIVYTWLYNRTGGSILAAVLFHGSFNFITASQAGTGLVAAVASTLVMVWAVAILVRWKSGGRPIGAIPPVQA